MFQYHFIIRIMVTFCFPGSFLTLDTACRSDLRSFSPGKPYARHFLVKCASVKGALFKQILFCQDNGSDVDIPQENVFLVEIVTTRLYGVLLTG